MDHFQFKGGVMHAEGVSLEMLAATVGTPFYCYSSATMERHFTVFRDAVAGLGNGTPLVAFAVKANPNLAVLATLARLGAGADVVSGGEMARALAAGVPAERIVFSGVGKTRAELAAGVEAGILQFNVESEAEIDMLAQVAAAKSATVEIAIRINPAVDPKTHGKISTGGADAKFGIPWERLPAAFAQAAAHPNLRPVGLAAHIGSQLTDLGPVEDAIRKLGDLARELEALGHKIKRVDVGGGLGVPYRRDQPAPPSPTDYAAMVARATAGWPHPPERARRVAFVGLGRPRITRPSTHGADEATGRPSGSAGTSGPRARPTRSERHQPGPQRPVALMTGLAS